MLTAVLGSNELSKMLMGMIEYKKSYLLKDWDLRGMVWIWIGIDFLSKIAYDLK